MPPKSASFYAIVPAAGVGRRLGEAVAKQYLPIGRRLVLQWTVDALLSAAWIKTVLVVVAPGDTQADALFEGQSRVQVSAVGGQTRRDSVLNGLRVLRQQDGGLGLHAQDSDWILVHDAARPGLSAAALARLHAALADEPVGALLALPCADSVKRARAHEPNSRVESAVDRDGLWLAQTPQVFRCGLLLEALNSAAAVTDEASAIECLGQSPVLVPGERENFKVTTRDDLELMRRLLTAHERPWPEPGRTS